jgi:hypothetical protein
MQAFLSSNIIIDLFLPKLPIIMTTNDNIYKSNLATYRFSLIVLGILVAMMASMTILY